LSDIKLPNVKLLNSSQQKQNDDDHQDEAQPAAWSIAPVSAMRPARNRAQQQENQDNHQDQT